MSEECGVSKNLLKAERASSVQMHDGCTRRQETAIKVHQANELSQMALGGGLWKGTDGLDLVLHRLNALAADEMSQEIERWHTKNALAGVDGEAMFCKTL